MLLCFGENNEKQTKIRLANYTHLMIDVLIAIDEEFGSKLAN